MGRARGQPMWVEVAGPVWALLLLVFTSSAAAGAETRYDVEPQASQVRIELQRAGLLGFLGHDHIIDAPLEAGRLRVDFAHPERSRVWLRWRAALLAIVPGSEPAKDVAEVEQRMRGPDVLDAARFGDILFVSESVHDVAHRGAGWKMRIEGSLRVRGQPHRVEIPLEVDVEGPRLTAKGTVGLELRALGVEPPSVAGVVKVANGFRLVFEVQAREADRAPPSSSAGP